MFIIGGKRSKLLICLAKIINLKFIVLQLCTLKVGGVTRYGKNLFLGIFEAQQAILPPTQSDKFLRVFNFPKKRKTCVGFYLNWL